MSETAATEDVKEKQKCCRVIAVGSSSSGSRKSTRVGSTNNSMKEKGDEEEVEGGEKEIERGEKEEIKGEKRVGDRKGSVADVLLPWVLRFAGRKDFRCCVRESTSDKQERLSRGVGLGEKYGSSRRDDFLEEKNGTAARGRPGGGLAHGEVKATSHSVSHAKKTVSAIESHVARSSSSREGEGEEGGRRDRDAAGSSTRCDLSAREAAKKAAEATAAAGRAAQAEVAVAYNKCLVRRSGRKGRRKKSSRSVPSSDLSSDRCRRESSSCRAFPGSSGSSNSSSPTVVVASSTGSSLAVCSGVQGSCKNSVRSTKTSRRSSSSRGLSVCRPGGSSSSSKTSSKGSKQVTRLYKLTRCGRALASLETLFFQQHLGLQPPRMRGLLAHIDRLSDEGRIPAAAAAATADGPRAVAAADCGRAKSTADRKTRYPRGRREEEKEQGEQKEERADGKREAEEEDGRRDLRDKEKGGEEQPVEGKGKKDGFEGERKRRIDEESSVSDEAKTRLPARLHAARNSSSSSIAVGSSPSSSSSNSGSNCSRTSSSRSSSSSTAGEGSSSSSSGRRRRSARGSTPVNSIEAGVDCASSRCCSSSDPGHRSVTRSSRNSGTPGSSSSGTLEEGAATACYLGETKGGEKGLASVSEAEAYYSSGSLHVAATAAAAGKHWTRVLNSGKRGEDCENMDLFPPLSKKVLAAVEKLLERPPVGLLAVAVVAPRSAPLAASTAKQQRHQQHERQQKQLQQEQPQHHQRRKGSRKSQLRDTEETQGATQECGVEEEERFVLREEIQGEEATAKREVEQKGGGEDQKGGEGEEADEEEEGGQEEYEGNEEDDMDAQVLVVRPLQLDKEGARESGSRRLPAVMRKRSSSKFIRKSFSDAACSSWNGVAGDVQAGAVAAATATAAPTAAAPATARLHRTVPAGDRKGRSSEGSSPARAAVNAAAAAAAAGGKAAGAAAAVFQATAAAAAVPALRDTEELVADAESPKGNWKLDSKRGYAEERETFVWKPFPTALWLCGSELKKTISAVEGSGLTKQIEKEIRRSSSLQQHVLSDALRYIAMRWLLVDCSLLRHFYCMRRKAAAAEDEAVVSTENARKDEEEHGKGVEEEERPDMLAAAVQDSDAAAGAGTSSVAAAVADRKHLTWGETHSQGQVLQKATRKEQRSTCSSENSSGTSRGGRSEGSSRRSSSGSNGEGKSSSDSSSESKSSSSKYNSSMDCSAGGSSSSSGSSSVRLEAKDAEKEAAAASARRHVTAATKGSGRADAVMQPCCSCRICKSLQVLRVRGIGGVGDFFSVRCLHMHYAFHLLFPASAVGLLMERHLQKRRAAAANLDQRQQQQLRQERQQSSGGSSTGQAAEPIAGEAVAATVALKQQQTKTQACSTTAAAPTPAAAARESSEEDLHNSCSSGEERKLRTTRACSIRNHLAVEKEEHGLTAKGKLHEQSRETYSNRRR